MTVHTPGEMTPAQAPRALAGSQTLSRGLSALEILSEAHTPLTVQELADALGVHRSVAYRILRTLEEHRLVSRDDAGKITLAPRLATIAMGVATDLRAAATPVATALANDLGITAFVAVLDQDEVVTLLSVEPQRAHATVAQHPGSKHPLTRGAPGRAVQALLSHSQRQQLAHLPLHATPLTDGYAATRDEVIHGLASVAVPLFIPGEPAATLAVVYLVADHHDEATIGKRLEAAAAQIAQAHR